MAMPSLAGLIKKMFHTGWAPEGQWRPAAGVGELGNIFSIPFGDGFQRNLAGYNAENGIVYSLVQCYVMALGGSGLDIRERTPEGGWKTITAGAAFQTLRYPNPAQTQIEFLSYMVSSLMYTGNFYAYAVRNGRYEITELWPLSGMQRRAVMAPDGSLFYDVSNEYEWFRDQNLAVLVPARDVLHVKLPSHSSLYHGDSLITHAAGPKALNSIMQANATTFAANNSQPSGIISTDLPLNSAQMIELRQRFDEQTTGANRGGVPILGGGMKFYPMGVTAKDSELVNVYNMSVLDLCRIFRVPPQVLGLETNGAATGVESLINQWRASGLLYFAELIEEALERLFDFSADQSIVFDLDNISRADSKTAMEVLTMGVQNAVYSPNEARNKVGLDSVDYGDSPRIQAQNVRLQDAVPAPSAPAAPVAPAAPQEPVIKSAAEPQRGKRGEQGPPGRDGHTPTEEEITAIMVRALEKMK